MTAGLLIEAAGPALTLQDYGRPGLLSQGVSCGGAADTVALAEARALLGGEPLPAIEMAGMGGRFSAEGGPLVVALTGAPMRAKLGGEGVPWGGTLLLEPGVVLEIGPVLAGTYGYLSVAGGFEVPEVMGARSAHLACGIGGRLEAGTRLGIRPGPAARPGLALPADDRFGGGTIRVLPGPQSDRFDAATTARFHAATFTKGTRANRMGVEFTHPGEPFGTLGALTILSEMTVPGDIQMTGGGEPFVLGPECQSTGGYPRIATVIPTDLPRAMQAPPGAEVRFVEVTRAEALAALRQHKSDIGGLKSRPRLRDPHDIPDLLSYQLIDGIYGGETGP